MGDSNRAVGKAGGGSGGRGYLRPRNIVLGVVGLVVLLVLWQGVWAMTATHGPIGDRAGELRALSMRAQGLEVVGESVSAEEAERVGGAGLRDLRGALDRYSDVMEVANTRYGLSAPDELVPPGEFIFEMGWPIDAQALWGGSDAPEVLVGQTREALGLFIESGGLVLLDSALGAEVILIEPTYVFDETDVSDLRRIGVARQLSGLVAGRMHWAASSHDAEEARAWLGRALRLSSIYSHQSTLIEFISGLAQITQVLGVVGDLITAERLDEPTAAALLEELNAFAGLEREQKLGGVGNVVHVIRGERALSLLFVDRFHSSGGRLIPASVSRHERALASSMPGGGGEEEPRLAWVENLHAWRYPSKAQTVRELDRYYDALIEPLVSREGAERQAGFDVDRFLDGLSERQRIVPMIVDPFWNSPLRNTIGDPTGRRAWSEIRQLIALARLALAAELYRLRTGEIPRDAAVLVGTVLDEPVREPVELWRDASEGRALTFDDLRSDVARRIGLTGVGGE